MVVFMRVFMTVLITVFIPYVEITMSCHDDMVSWCQDDRVSGCWDVRMTGCQDLDFGFWLGLDQKWLLIFLRRKSRDAIASKNQPNNLKSIAPELSLSVSSIISSISSCPGLSPRKLEISCYSSIWFLLSSTHRGTWGRLPIPLWILCRLHPDN